MAENSKNYYFWNEAAFKNAFREQVCPGCEYSGPARQCLNPDPRGCVLLRHLPDLVRVAQRMERSDRSYESAAREQVAFDAPLRNLALLLPSVLDMVMKTDEALEARSSEPAGRMA